MRVGPMEQVSFVVSQTQWERNKGESEGQLDFFDRAPSREIIRILVAGCSALMYQLPNSRRFWQSSKNRKR